jgi:serine/threonine-protein kinase
MKRSGPLLTLLAGLLVGLFMLSLNATTGEKATSSYVKPPASGKPSAGTKASPSPAPAQSSTPPGPSPTRAAVPEGVYTGRTDDDSSAVAITVRDDKAIAYVCDGRNVESWLQGDVKADGSLRLTGKGGASLDGKVKGAKEIRGTAHVGSGSHAFTLGRSKKSSGLYRANSTVAGARIEGGWIVLPDGEQVGILKRDGKPSPAPEIDPETGAVTVDGQQLTARPVTP